MRAVAVIAVWVGCAGAPVVAADGDAPPASGEVSEDAAGGEVAAPDTLLPDVLGADVTALDVGVPEETTPPDTVADVPAGDTDAGEPPAWLATLDAAGLDALSQDGGGVKYLASLPGAMLPAPLQPGCVFHDMHRWAYHIEFLRTLPGLEALAYDEYLSWVLVRPTRILWGGEVDWVDRTHPRTGAPGIVTYGVYGEQKAGSITVDDLVALDTQLEACLPTLADRLVFVPADVWQRQLVAAGSAALAAGDVDVLLPEALPR